MCSSDAARGNTMLDTADSPAKKVKIFDWSEVSPGLIRSMLATAYRATGQNGELDKLDHLSDAALPAQAERSLDRPPRSDVMGRPEMVDLLRAQWLPTVDQKDLSELAGYVQLSLSGPERTADVGTKTRALTFLRERRRTKNLHKNLRAMFVRLHKVSRDAASSTIAVQRAYTGPIQLIGENATPWEAYDHQKDAWRKLDQLAAASGRRGGLLVLPTGSGKTFTVVHWLLQQMAHNPQLRVLWVADQQELLEQAARAFESHARALPGGFQRQLRVMHTTAGPVTALGDSALDVACVTRQSVVGRSQDAMEARLKSFLQRPAVVVVDEAHHAVATGYERMLDTIEGIAPRTILLGLTATPWPSGPGAVKRLNTRFATPVAEVDIPSLVRDKVLARPMIHTVASGEHIRLDAEDVAMLRKQDFTSELLGELDRESRNKVIVDTWTAAPATWGKTLVFVGTINHADHLATDFGDADVPCQVLHSGAGRREEVLAEFRAANGPRVLVSVGMLLEGVDLPDAQTAMLARPTRSPVLLRQMVGRVLRGPRAGGGAVAHVIAIEDHWLDGIDVLSPVDLRELTEPLTGGGEAGGLQLPPIRDEQSGPPISEDLLRRIERAFAEIRTTPTVTVGDAVLVGFYEALDVSIPVFDHTRETWEELIAARVAGRKTATHSPRDLFGDLPVPRPTPYDVDAVVDYIASTEEAPPFTEIKATFSMREAAQRLWNQPPMTQQQVEEWERNEYESTLARTVYSTPDAFSEALHQQVRALRASTPAVNPEAVRVPRPIGRREPLRRATTRELQPLFDVVLEEGWNLLDEAGEDEYAAILSYPPRVDWTRNPVKRSYAHWVVRMSSRAKGQPEIRVNRKLQAPATQVSDELLQFLLWHELCHHVLPAHGHDAEFNRLLFLWPDAVRLDNDMDQLGERFEMDL